MSDAFHIHDLVALLEDIPAKHFDDGRALMLRRGQIGTVVTKYPDGACEVEFADREGRTYAMLSLTPNQLMTLHDLPDYALV
ncbi:MAG: DUF4926 domain-containing protein [Candidatus Hydrogenedentes bacterium]|nr:DUF4926 domain-containing protein [Candidatus Hydrogenedentota bacterium]